MSKKTILVTQLFWDEDEKRYYATMYDQVAGERREGLEDSVKARKTTTRETKQGMEGAFQAKKMKNFGEFSSGAGKGSVDADMAFCSDDDDQGCVVSVASSEAPSTFGHASSTCQLVAQKKVRFKKKVPFKIYNPGPWYPSQNSNSDRSATKLTNPSASLKSKGKSN